MKEKTINSRIKIENPVTGQVEEISVFYQDDAIIHVPRVNPLTSLNLGLVDIILLLIVVVVIISLAYSMNNYTTTGSNVPQSTNQPHNLSTSGSYGRGILNSTYGSAQDTPIRSSKEFYFLIDTYIYLGLNSFRNNNYPERDAPRDYYSYNSKFNS